ncbi:MAG: WG repeat-containing protein [Leptospiraceae bacterium]|nr:WG repeat-containing protein [Leptospiraceae bacterium]
MHFFLILFLLLTHCGTGTGSNLKNNSTPEESKVERKKKIHGFINTKGELAISLMDYYHAESFSEGLAAVFSKSEKKCGYIDKSGKLVIPTKFNYCGKFSSGLAKIKSEKLYGFINKEGKNVVPEIYKSATAFNSGFALVKKENQSLYTILDSDGKELSKSKFKLKRYSNSEYANGLFLFKKKGKFGYRGLDGEKTIREKFDTAKPFQNGFAAISIKDRQGKYKYGLIDTSGNYVLQPEFQQVSQAWKEEDNSNSYITYSSYSESTGCTIYTSDKKTIFHAKEVDGLKCFGIEPFKYGAARILLLDEKEKNPSPYLGVVKQSFINKEGKLLFPPVLLQFKNRNQNGIASFCNYNRAVMMTFFSSKESLQKAKEIKRTCGFINSKGEVLASEPGSFLNLAYRSYSDSIFDDSWMNSNYYPLVAIGDDKNKKIFNYLGRSINFQTNRKYRITSIQEDRIPFCTGSGSSLQCGYLDIDGNEVIPPKYKNISEFSEGLAFVYPTE